MGISVVIENGSVRIVYGSETEKRTRKEKGKSLLSMVDDFVCIDLETTGLSPEYCEIIEIGCIRYRSGQPVDSYSSLVKPENIDAVDGYISQLTGITPELLADAPNIGVVLPQALAFIGSDIVVGHNVSFDINFIYDNAVSLGLPVFGNDYIDTMRMSRKLFPDFVNHKLRTLVREFDIAKGIQHRAAGDAEQTALCYRYMVDHVKQHGLESALAPAHSNGSWLRSADIAGDPEKVREDNPLYGKTVVFTGTLERMTRREAMQVVADLGGINGDTVTKKTNYLVLGNNDMCASIKDGKSSKHKKAEKYILGGADLTIISENVFYDMLSE